MTIDISNNNPRISYSVGSAVTQTTFSIPFEFFDDSDLNVYVDNVLQTITTHYTVSGGDGSTGTLTMSVTGPKTVLLTRDTTIERTTDFTAGVDINRAALNTQLDTLTAISADNKDLSERSIRLPDYDPATANLLLPDAATRADKLLSFDTEGAVSLQGGADLLTGSVLGANYTKASHTGNGTTVAFSTTESAGSKNNIQVYVDGVYQNKDTFSISGATLTFTEAPPTNSAIEFIVGNSVTSISGDASAITYNQGGTGAQDRTVRAKLQETVSVKDFGAVGDGVTDDTAAIQAAISGVDAGTKIFFPEGTYVVTQVDVTKALTFYGPATINLSGLTAGFELKANMSGICFKDLTFVGDGVTGNNHRAIWHTQTYTISDVRIENINVSSCVQAIDLGGVDDILVTGCTIKSSAGSASGQGYGIVAGSSTKTKIIGNHFEDNGRHAIYIRSGEDIAISSNTFLDHATTSSSGLQTVNLIGAINATVDSNQFKNCEARSIKVDDDTNTSTPSRNVVVSNNTFYNTSGDEGGLYIGASTPSATSFQENVIVSGNAFYMSPARTGGCILISQGKTVSVIGNNFFQTQTTATNFYAIYLDASGGVTYYGDISIIGNAGQITASSGTAKFLFVGSPLSTGSNNIIVKNNDVQIDALANLIEYGTAPTNSAIETDWLYEKAVTLASGSQTISGSGYNYFVITGDAGASTLTNITNGYEGKAVTLRFVDANTTITRGNAFLAGGANFVSTARDILQLTLRSSQWYEVTRSVNS